MGHYGWSDDDSDEDLTTGEDDAAEARSDALTRADEQAEADLNVGDFSGVTWSP